jgi:diguanylate cyclase (GGDEF)-like protein
MGVESHQRAGRRGGVDRFVALVVLLVATVVGTVVLHSMSEAASVRSTTSGEAADAIALIELRIQGEAVLFDELNTRVLTALGYSTIADTDEAVDERLRVITDVRSELAVIGSSDSSSNDEAPALLAALDESPIVGAEPKVDAATDLALVYSTAAMIRFENRPAGRSARLEALDQFAIVTALAPLILDEANIADYSIGETAVDASVEEYLQPDVADLATDAGWLGPDPSSPTTDAVMEFDLARPEYATGLSTIDAILVAHDITIIDQWLRSFRKDVPSPPPASMDEIAGNVQSATLEIHAVVADVLVAEKDEYLSSATVDDSAARMLRASAAISALLAAVTFAVLGWLATRHLRRSNERSKMVSIDALTSIGNRRELDERTSMLLADPRFHQHVLAVLDLDRFKLINDSRGHAVGDAVLIETARRLSLLAASAMSAARGTATSVIRLGGDEFLYSLHSPHPVDVAAFTTELHGMGVSPVELADGTTVPLHFSIGVASYVGAAQLYDLMSVADLAAYEEKAERAALRRDTDLSDDGDDDSIPIARVFQASPPSATGQPATLTL